MLAEVTANELSATALPTVPVKVVVPDPPAIVNACAPLRVLPKLTFALFEVIVLVPVKETGIALKLRGLAPETMILAPTWIRFALVNIILVGGTVPPIAPAKETVPVPACKVRVVAPLIVLVEPIKLIFAPPPVAVLKIGVPLMVTGPVAEMVPFVVVVILPPILIAVDPV